VRFEKKFFLFENRTSLLGMYNTGVVVENLDIEGLAHDWKI
jgi:hypothetical protein